MKEKIQQLSRQLYDFVRKANYRFEFLARNHSVGNLRLRSYEPLNAHRIDTESLLSALRAETIEGETVYDVGASIGTHSLVIGKTLNVTVHSFEPNPIVYRWLVANVQANDLLAELHTHHMGLSDRDGTRQLYPAHRQSTFQADSDSKQTYGVPVRRLDTFIEAGHDPPDRLKVDVEGHGKAVLQGAQHTLREHEPVVYMEHHANAEALGAILQDQGYEVTQFSTHLVAR